ncbi:MAG: hypothetical protein ABEJ58_07910 [Halodesulfurarchaeum sp.]
MTGHVYRLSASFELPLEDLEAYLDDPELPDEVEALEVNRRNNILLIKGVAADTSLSKYTPTAQLKANIKEKRVYEEEEPRASGPRWASDDEEDEEPKSELVTMANFSGDREAVLQNTAIQYPMFTVLKDIAMLDTDGTLTAITAEDEELAATKIVDGEEVSATIEVVEEVPEGTGGSSGSGVDWRGNPYISE